MSEEKIKLKCVSKYPFIEVMGIGKFKKGEIKEFSGKIAKILLKTTEWEKFKEKKEIIITKPKLEKESLKKKSKKSEVKNV